jgi:hypothetical protein
MSLEEILIDHDLDDSDRALRHKADIAMKILTIYF